MEGIRFEEFVYIRPKPDVLVNVSRQIPSQVEQACRNLQKKFRDKKCNVMLAEDVAELTCAFLLVILVTDLLSTLCTKKVKLARLRGDHACISERSSNLGIVIAAFMVQITRPTSLLGTIESAESYGIVGCISEAVNFALVYTLFVLLLLEFRTKAPGAQTIAQFMRHRFGAVAHILTITLSLLTGLYTLSINIIVGSKILDAVTLDVSKTAIVSIFFILVGAMVAVAQRRSCSLILYIIITTILLICAFLVIIMLNVPAFTPFGSVDSLYKLLMCYNKSSHRIKDRLIDGTSDDFFSNSLISLIQHVVLVVLDQALWETAINLPPNFGAVGLLLAIIMAFCIPFAFGIVCGLGFQALESAFSNEVLLSKTQKVSGLLLFATPIHLLGKGGVWIMFIVILLLLVTSCMFSIIGASSILYHDVLATYIRPFKKQVDGATCLLCGKRRGHLASRRNICRCRSMLECEACHTDTWIKEECGNRPAVTLVYGCQTHGAFRAYTDRMEKGVLHIAFTVMAGMVPIFIIFPNGGVASILCFGLCAPFVGCLCLSILWARLSKAALLIGYFISATGSLTLWFVFECASSLDIKQIKLMGLGVAILGGFLLPTLITLLSTKDFSPEIVSGVWSCVQEIDNPLAPWPEVFTREKKPALSEVRRALAPLRNLIWGIAVFNFVVFLGFWRILGHAMQKLHFDCFFLSVEAVEIWTYLSTAFCLTLPMALLVSHKGTYLRHQLHKLRMMMSLHLERKHKQKTSAH